MTPYEFPIEATHIMMFARSVGDNNPIYHDSDYAATTEVGTIIAPPTFVQASAQFDPDYHLRPKHGEPWLGSGVSPTGIEEKERASEHHTAGGVLHAEQHFEYHRHPRPGDVLTTTSRPGNSWIKHSKRAGELIFKETIIEYRDQTGELVVIARSVSVQTEKAVKGNDNVP